ncbi:TrbI/VirB10 family protein [Pseudogemmobacter humi]|uniref:TrbI/VirB10 family protein n=1 Tax=Pseudogemmobacter humi TaxID=2483812 RepID=UPI0018EF448B|nr:TrbI/VirB10 family protein [Pseudogemmobacter humi]
MTEEEINLNKRLEEISGGPVQSGRSKPSPAVAILGVAAIGIGGGLIYLLSNGDRAEPPLPTAVPDEFQQAGPGFGQVPAWPPEPAPAPVQSEPAQATGPSETEIALMETVAALRAEIEAIRAATPSTDDSAARAAQEQIDLLSQQLAQLQRDAEQRERERQREAQERDRELRRLQSELDLARLAPPAPAASAVDPEWEAEQARLEELRRRREAEAAALDARIRSPMIAYGSGGTDSDPAAEARLHPDDAFVREGAAVARVTQAVVIANPSNTVVQGTIIQAVMTTALDSSLPGTVRAIVSEDVHSYDGARVLIPRGSQLVGRYNARIAIGQQRVTVAWDRIILPDNQSVELSAYGADALGRSGTTGAVDNRFGARFGSAALVSLIGAGPAIAAAQIDDTTTRDTARGVTEDLQDTTGSIMSEYMRLPPIIRVDQGARIAVMVDRDLEIF